MESDIFSKQKVIFEILIINLGMILFGLFINRNIPFKFIAFFGITITSIVLFRSFIMSTNNLIVIGIVPINKKVILFVLLGALVGGLFACFYRLICDRTLFLRSIQLFAVVAILIGVTEELLFRGYIQAKARFAGIIPAILIGTMSHTLYKTALFILDKTHSIDIIFLVIWTFAGGIVFGILRETSGSIYPALMAHGLFDLLVYGDQGIPWWV